MQGLTLPTKHPYQYMNQHFTMEDLKFLCQDLGVQYENLGGGDQLRSKALNLQSQMSRNLQLGVLLARIPHQQSAGYNPDEYIYLLIEDHINAEQITSICQALALPCQELSLSPQDLTPYDHNNRFRREKAQILHAYAVQEKRQKELLEAMQKLAPTLNLDAFTQPLPVVPAPPPPVSPPPPSNVVTYENFDLRIGVKREDGKYPVEVLASPHGQVDPEWYEFPVDDPEFFAVPALLKRLRAEGADAKKLGQKIFAMLFPGNVAGKYIQCYTSTKMEGKGLRLRLRIDPPELDQWPWEYCFHPQYNYLAQNKMTPFVRFPAESIKVGSIKMPTPMHVLFVTANPQGAEMGLAELDPAKERDVVEKALKPLIDAGQVVLDILESPASAEKLDEKIYAGNYDILHYFGHGIVLEDGQGALALEDEFDGSVQPLDAEQMSAVLLNSSLKVIFLNACHVGGHEGQDPMNSIGRSLVHAGVPVVVAMQSKLPQKTAHLFSQRLYASLAKGEPFDQAISSVRRSAFISTRDKTHWGIPVLTMRAEDGSF